MKPIEFKSNYFLRLLKLDLHPFTPNILRLEGNHIEFRRRNWHMISVDSESLSLHNVTGITVDKHVFGATLKIKSTGTDPILVHGFWKKEANQIKDLVTQRIQEGSGRGTQKSNSNHSVADEIQKLKALLDQGLLSDQEFEDQKRKILNS